MGTVKIVGELRGTAKCLEVHKKGRGCKTFSVIIPQICIYTMA